MNTRGEAAEVDIHKAAGILLQDGKLLVTRTSGKDFFMSPGGKVEPGETPQQALVRELKEELAIEVRIEDLAEFGTFYAEATGQENKTLKMEVLTVMAWKGIIMPSSEVAEIRWMDSSSVGDITLSSIFLHDVLPTLKEQKLVA
jgi:mutator protein MutT